jgi:hypothetical protein
MVRASLVLLLSMVTASAAADWPQWGGSPQRNNAPEAKNLPVEWDAGKFDAKSGKWNRESAKGIRWVARLGSTTYGTPVVAGGRVFCATNNGAGWIARYPAKVDLGCLLCFRQTDGQFQWQLSREKVPTDASTIRNRACAPCRWSRAAAFGSSPIVVKCCVSMPPLRRARRSRRSSGGST